MDISSLSGSVNQQNTQRANARLQAAIAQLVSGSRITRAADDVAALSLATQLQTSTAGLRQLSTNLAQARSQTQVADGGAEQIQNVLGELRSLAQQASNPTLNSENRAQLNEQFQQLVQQIDSLAQNTNFNGQKLLDGSNSLSLGDALNSQEESGENVTLDIDDLSSGALFDGQSLNILSADAAAQAVETLSSALGKATGVRASVGAFQQTLDYVSASIDTAVINQEAARAVLSDTDFAEASTQFSLADLQRNLSLALAAQTNRLPPTLLKLLG